MLACHVLESQQARPCSTSILVHRLLTVRQVPCTACLHLLSVDRGCRHLHAMSWCTDSFLYIKRMRHGDECRGVAWREVGLTACQREKEQSVQSVQHAVCTSFPSCSIELLPCAVRAQPTCSMHSTAACIALTPGHVAGAKQSAPGRKARSTCIAVHVLAAC